jgi:hypothetical protein
MNAGYVSKTGKLAAFAGVAASLLLAGGALGQDKTFRGLRKGDYDNQPRQAASFNNNRGGGGHGGHGGGYDRGRDHDRTRVNFNVNLGWAGSSYNRYDRCDDRVVIVNRGRDHHDYGWNRDRCDDNRVVIVNRPCPPPVVVAPCPPPVVIAPPCPPRAVIIEKPCPPAVIVREVYTPPQPTVIVREAVHTTYQSPTYQAIALCDRAEEQLRAGRLSIAADLYREHLRTNPSDDYVRRALGYTLLTDNKFEDAIGVISSAYDSTPVLARSTFALGLLPDGGGCLGARLQEVRAIADRSNSWQAYVTAAAIAQSIGSFDLAAQLTDRARACGLNEKTTLELTLAVTGGGR